MSEAPVIPSRIGHGQLGLRGHMPVFEEMVERPVYDKRVVVEVRPAAQVSGWTLLADATYVSVFDPIFQGARLDVRAVRTLLDAGLVRVGSLAQCQASPGTFFFQPFSEAVGALIAEWDDAVTLWDDGEAVWDQASFLFVHLFDGSDPNATIVTAQVGFFLANKATEEASLGVNTLSNGGFEQRPDFDGWAIGAGDATLTIETTSPLRGTRSARWDMNSPSTNEKVLSQTRALLAGQRYRVSFVYALTLTAQVQVEVETPSGAFVQANGRDADVTADTTIRVSDTQGETRRAVFDFIAPEDGDHVIKVFGVAPPNPSAPATWDDAVTLFDDGATLWDDFGVNNPVAVVDDVALQEVYRFEYHEPRIDGRALPQVQSGSRDIFFAAQQIGSGSIVFINGDGFFDEALEQFIWENQELFILFGGASRDGEEMLVGDFKTQFKAVMRRDATSDVDARFDLDDVRGFILQGIPTNTFDLITFPGMAAPFVGAVRRLWFGPKTNIPPVRVAIAANDLGSYELADPTVLPNGITSVDEVRAYPTAQLALAGDITSQVVLIPTIDYLVDLATARVTLLRDAQVIEVTDQNNFLDWDQGGAQLTVQVPAGFYTPATLALAAQAAINTIGGAGKTLTYDETTHLVTTTKAIPTYSLLLNTGTNKANHLWPLLGFDAAADLTGLTSYTAQFPLFEAGENEAKHHLRVDGVGARDTVPDGRFTGVSGDPIQIGADDVRVLWELVLGQPAELIDEASFLAARASAPEPLGIYLDSTEQVRSVFQKIQNSNRANIVVDGEGAVRFIVNQPGVAPSGTPELEDDDYLSFRVDKKLDDVFSKIQVRYDENPSTGALLIQEASSLQTEGVFGRFGVKTFDTYLTAGNDAAVRALSFLDLSREPIRLAEFSVKLLVDKVEGDKVFLTRERAVDATGQLSSELFRILLVRKQPDSAEVQVLAVEDR